MLSGKSVHVQVTLTSDSFREGEDVGLVIAVDSRSSKTEIVSWIAIQFQSFSEMDKTARDLCPLSATKTASSAHPATSPDFHHSPVLAQVRDHFASMRERGSAWKETPILDPEPSIAIVAKNIVIEPFTSRRWVYGFHFPVCASLPPSYRGNHVRMVHRIAIALKMYKASAPQALIVPLSLSSSSPSLNLPISSSWFRQGVAELCSLAQIQFPLETLSRILHAPADPQTHPHAFLETPDVSPDPRNRSNVSLSPSPSSPSVRNVSPHPDHDKESGDDFDDSSDDQDFDDQEEEEEDEEEKQDQMFFRSRLSAASSKATHFQINCDDQTKVPLLRLSVASIHVGPGQTINGMIHLFASTKTCHQITLSVVVVEELKSLSPLSKNPSITTRKIYAQQDISTTDLVCCNWSLWIPPITPIAFETPHMRVSVCLRMDLFLSKTQSSIVCALLDHLEPSSHTSGVFGRLIGGSKDHHTLDDYILEEVTGLSKEIVQESRSIVSRLPNTPIETLSCDFPLHMSLPSL